MSNHLYVVDDDPAIGRLSRMILQSEGFKVEAFTSPLEAFANLADRSLPDPAAIILDLNMPDMDGWEFYRRAREVGCDSPVLILSAFGAKAAKSELGADAALAKPFEPDVLASTVRGLVLKGE